MGGPNDLATKQRKHVDLALDPSHGKELEPAPGKTTGVGIVDNPMLCERGLDHAGCYLTETQRTRLLVALSTVVLNAFGNARDAIHNKRIELLTVMESKNGWGALEELLFVSGSTFLIGSLMKSLTVIKERATEAAASGEMFSIAGVTLPMGGASRVSRINIKHITGLATSVSKTARTGLKNAAHGQPGAPKENVEAAEFLKLIQGTLAPTANQLVLDAPASLTDGELAALVAAYEDQTYHSIDAYEAELTNLIDRYKAQQLASIGDGLSNGTDYMSRRQAVLVVANGKSRVAIVEFFDKAFAGPIPVKSYDGHIVPWETTQFVAWVDDDLAGVARAYQSSRVAPMQILPADGKTNIREIDAWATETP